MKKLTNLIKKDSNNDYTAKVNIKLDNGLVFEGLVNVEEFNESYAIESTNKSLINSSIEAVEIKSVELKLENKSAEQKEKGKEDNCYYIPFTSWLSNDTYDVDQMKKIVKEYGGKNIKMEKQFGWDNQPDVVVFKLDNNVDHSEYTLNKERLVNKIKHSMNTEWIRVSKKDW